MKAIIKQAPVIWFVLLTVGLTFASYLLPLPREILPLLIVFIPTVIAASLVAITGDGTVGSLFAQFAPARLSWKWALIAFGLGLVLRVAITLVGLALGLTTSFGLDGFTPLLVIVFIFAAAEEIGWRGYALPKVIEKQSPLTASLILGVPWASLHLALFLPGMMYDGLPIIPTMITMMALSVLCAWAYVGAGKGGVLASTLLHGSQNMFVFLNRGLEPATANWLMAAVFTLAAVIVVVLARRQMVGHSPTPIPASQPL